MEYARRPTDREVKEIKAIIWKYFTPYVADQVLKGVGLRKGEAEFGERPWCRCKETEPDNIEAAAKEYFAYLGKRGIGGVHDRYLNQEEMALVYYSGFIYPEPGYVPRTVDSDPLHKSLFKKLYENEKALKKLKKQRR